MISLSLPQCPASCNCFNNCLSSRVRTLLITCKLYPRTNTWSRPQTAPRIEPHGEFARPVFGSSLHRPNITPGHHHIVEPDRLALPPILFCRFSFVVSVVLEPEAIHF